MNQYPVRGFACLVGETIKKIDARAINLVTIETESGKTIDIDCDEHHFGIAVIQCKEIVVKPDV